MFREGYQQSNAIEVYDYKVEKNKIIVYTPFKSIQTKGDTLNLGMLTIEITSPIKNVISIEAYLHIGGLKK